MFSIFPKADHEQTLRIKRFLMAFGAYLIWSAICFVAYSLDLTTVPLKILIEGVSASFFVNILLYVIFRTGLNKRFKDPSLTLVQMVIATFWIMVVVYYAYEARSAVLLVYMVVLVFGFFRLKARQFLFLSVYAWINYSFVIFILYKIHPESVNKRVDIFNIIVLAFILPWFSMIGGYITKLRGKIASAFSTIEGLNNNIQDVIFVLDMNLKYTYVSPSVKVLRGYAPEEVLKQALFDALAPSSLDQAKKTLSEFIELVKLGRDIPVSQMLQLEIKRKDGTTVWTETKISFIRDKNKRPISILGVIRDNTERKQMEELLKKNEKQYRLLADHMTDPVWLMDLDLKWVYISPSVEKLVGYTLEELKQIPLDKFLPATSFQKAMEFFPVQLSAALQNPSEYLTPLLNIECCCKNGSTLWIETAFSFILDETGNPLSILGEGRNITERKHMEEKFRDEEQRFRALAEQSSDIILMVNKQKAITYENPAVSILGINAEKRIGANVFEHVHPDDMQSIIDSFNVLFSDINAPVQKAELRIHHADGSWRTFEAMGSNLVRNNVIEAAIVNLHDITERKMAEVKLQQTLDSLKKAIGTTIQVLVSALETRDPYTAGHQSRSADLACAIATEMGLDQDKIEGIQMAGIIHDIGKLSVPAEILTKPSKLTNLEFSLIKEHAQCGYEMLKDVESPWPLAQIVHQHHERMNGTGYPMKLKGDEILLESRIMAVADVVEAMASHRPYRAALGIEAALKEIEENKGTLYDAAVADACLRLFREKGYQLP